MSGRSRSLPRWARASPLNSGRRKHRPESRRFDRAGAEGAVNPEEKAKEVGRLKADLEKANCVFVVNFEKIPVVADWELRRQVRAAGGRYRVVKNTL
ncbi:MAG: 50S ribosomal protein L10, partial [Terriglobia bacterium]